MYMQGDGDNHACMDAGPVAANMFSFALVHTHAVPVNSVIASSPWYGLLTTGVPKDVQRLLVLQAV